MWILHFPRISSPFMKVLLISCILALLPFPYFQLSFYWHYFYLIGCYLNVYFACFYFYVRTANISYYISSMFFLIRSLLLFGFYPDTQFMVVLQYVLFNDAVDYKTPTIAGQWVWNGGIMFLASLIQNNCSKTRPGAVLSTTNSTWNRMRWNLPLRGERWMTNFICHGTATRIHERV
jgi:hypothetical protein